MTLMLKNFGYITHFCVHGTVLISTHCTASSMVGRGSVGHHISFPWVEWLASRSHLVTYSGKVILPVRCSAKILFNTKDSYVSVQIRCCAAIVPHGISPRSTFSQTAVSRYVAVRVHGPCPSMLWEIYLVFVWKDNFVFFSVGSFQSPYHTVLNLYILSNGQSPSLSKAYLRQTYWQILR